MEIKDDPYDILISGDGDTLEWEAMHGACAYCLVNFEPICAGPNYGYFECPENPNRCNFNTDNPDREVRM